MNRNCAPRCLLLTAAICLAGSSPLSQAADRAGLSVAAANGQSDTTTLRVGLHSYWDKSWWQTQKWQVSGYWEAQLGYWDSDKGGAKHNNLAEIALTPVFRLEQINPTAGNWSPYIEAGIGLHLLSNTSIGDQNLSSVVQFGSLAGMGFRFGEASRYQLGYRFQHVSNASLKQPNDGMNLNEIRLAIDY